ncbi:MAG: hypothetical protein WD032_00065 [Nitrospirales bacterium]
MKTPRQHLMDVPLNPREDSGRKYKRRHTRVHLDSLKPIPPVLTKGAIPQCPKCQGLIFIEAGETMSQTIVRCPNCGWQPHYHAPMIKETEESRVMRTLTNQFLSGSGWDRLPVGW